MRSHLLAIASLFALPLAGYAQTTAPNYTAMWWNANESGWGLNIAHQGDVLFPMWFTYGANGQIQWYAVSGAAKQPDGSYAGEVFRFTGKPFNQIAGGQAFNASSKVGDARLRFTGTTALDFNYTVDGISQSKTLSRFNFGTEPTCTFTGGSRVSASNYTDIWWNQAESGWGLTLSHQSDSIFALWYTYDAAGAAQWVSALGSKQADGSFKGDLNRATAGTSFSQISGNPATSFPLPKVGEFELRFSDGETGAFKYRLDGIEQTKQISRFVFGAPVSVCSAAAPNPDPGGTANGCFRRPQVGDVRVSRVASTVNGTSTTEQVTDRYTGTTTLDGQTVLVREFFNAQGQRTARNLERINGDTLDILQIDGYDVATGALALTTKFSPPQKFPFNPPTTTTEYNYTGNQQTFGPTGMSLTVQYQQRFRRLADEAVSAPIGNYASACKIDLYTKISASIPFVGGFNYEIQGPTWTLPNVGQIRNDQTTGSYQIGPATIPSARAVSELISFEGNN